MCTYIPSLLNLPPTTFPASHPSLSSELSSLGSSFPLVIHITYGSVYLSVLPSQFMCSPSPSPCIRMLALYVCVSIPALKTGLLYHLSRFYTYVWNLIWSLKTDFPTEKITHCVVRSYYMSSV